MKRRRHVWLAAIVAAVPPLLAVLLVWTLVDPEAYAPRLAAAVEAATGRALSFGGPLHVRWSLWPTVSVEDVRLANVPGGSRPDMARVERIEATIALLPLLRHRLQIDALTLTGPNILFEQVGGAPNWVFTPDRPASVALPGSPQPLQARFGLRIRHVRVINGMVTFRFPATTRVIGLRRLAFDHDHPGGPAGLDAVLVYSDFKPFTLRARATARSGGGSSPRDEWTTRLDVAAFDASASAQGAMDLVGGYDLALAARVPRLEALNALLPEMRLPPLHGLVLQSHVGNGPVPGDLPVIGATHLSIGGADLADRVPGLALTGLELSLPKPDGVATMAATLRYRTQLLSLGGTIGVPSHLNDPVRVPLALHADTTTPGGGSPARLGVEGTVGLRGQGFDGLDATVSLRAAALDAYRPILSPLLPRLTGLSATAELSIPAKADVALLQHAMLNAAEAAGDGEASVRLTGSRALDATLHATRLDLDALLPAAKPRPPPPSPGGPIFPTAPLSWTTLRGRSLMLRARVDGFTLRGRSWPGLIMDGSLRDGMLRLDPMHVSLPGGGGLDGRFTVDASRIPAPVALTLHAGGIPLALIAEQAGLLGPINGTLVLDTQLRAQGDSPHALAASLFGPFSLTMRGGSIGDAMLGRMAASTLKKLNVAVPSQGQAPIRCFGVIGSFDAGVARIATIALDTGYLTLSGQGVVDLGRETMTLKLHPQARIAGSRVSVPVVMEGPIREARAQLDANMVEKVGLLFDGLFGGDHPKTCRTIEVL